MVQPSHSARSSWSSASQESPVISSPALLGIEAPIRYKTIKQGIFLSPDSGNMQRYIQNRLPWHQVPAHLEEPFMRALQGSREIRKHLDLALTYLDICDGQDVHKQFEILRSVDGKRSKLDAVQSQLLKAAQDLPEDECQALMVINGLVRQASELPQLYTHYLQWLDSKELSTRFQTKCSERPAEAFSAFVVQHHINQGLNHQLSISDQEQLTSLLLEYPDLKQFMIDMYKSVDHLVKYYADAEGVLTTVMLDSHMREIYNFSMERLKNLLSHSEVSGLLPSSADLRYVDTTQMHQTLVDLDQELKAILESPTPSAYGDHYLQARQHIQSCLNVLRDRYCQEYASSGRAYLSQAAHQVGLEDSSLTTFLSAVAQEYAGRHILLNSQILQEAAYRYQIETQLQRPFEEVLIGWSESETSELTRARAEGRIFSLLDPRRCSLRLQYFAPGAEAFGVSMRIEPTPMDSGVIRIAVAEPQGETSVVEIELPKDIPLQQLLQGLTSPTLVEEVNGFGERLQILQRVASWTHAAEVDLQRAVITLNHRSKKSG